MNKLTNLAKNLRQNQTQQEHILWNLLRNHKFHNLKFKRQHPLGNYIIDFIEGKIKYLIKEKRYDDANKLIEESLKKYEKTDFLLKYKADILYKTNKKEAIKLYNSLLVIFTPPLFFK